MADFGRGIKAGVISGLVYMAVAAILGAIYYNSIWSTPDFVYGAGLTLFTWRALTDPSSVASLFYQYLVRGIVFGAVFAALYHSLPGTASVKRGVVLSGFIWVLSAIGLIYMTPGWPIDTSFSWTYCGGGAVVLSSIRSALVGILSALVFGALTGLLWDGFQARRVSGTGKGSPALLLSFVLGALMWGAVAAMFLSAMVIGGVFPIQAGSWWFNVLFAAVVFLGLPGWVLTVVGWRKTRVDKSGFRWGGAGGIIMALTGIMLLPGALAVIGGVLSRRRQIGEPGSGAIDQ